MCGRFALDAAPEQIKAQFQVETLPLIAPVFNIAPRQEVLLLLKPPEEVLRGEFLVPYFAKDKKLFHL